jgi:hypothetical protein
LPRPPTAGVFGFRRACSRGHCAGSNRPFQPQLNETALLSEAAPAGDFGEYLDQDAENTARPAATKGIEPRISQRSKAATKGMNLN